MRALGSIIKAKQTELNRVFSAIYCNVTEDFELSAQGDGGNLNP